MAGASIEATLAAGGVSRSDDQTIIPVIEGAFKPECIEAAMVFAKAGPSLRGPPASVT
jgi:hypothetical protein